MRNRSNPTHPSVRLLRPAAIAASAFLMLASAPAWSDSQPREQQSKSKEYRGGHSGHKYDRSKPYRGRRSEARHQHRNRGHHSHYRGHGHHRSHDRNYRHRDRRYRSHGHYDRHRHNRRHYRHDRRHYRPYERYRSYSPRYRHYQRRHNVFSIPRRLHRHLLSRYSSYYHSRYYYADHGHHHVIYRFPVYVGYNIVDYRPYSYCGEDLYEVGYFTDDGPRFDIDLHFSF